ncbi:MAG: helix-turn-helix transcriptional regulator [Clostridia bacterium]|nr:helix-turn-helix transcriptional regulator [Clostridia bacterium]
MLRCERQIYKEEVRIHSNRLVYDHAAGKFEYDYIPMGKFGQCFEEHGHEEIELLSVEEGTLHAVIDGHEYKVKAGDILAMNPYALHSGLTDCSEERLVYKIAMFSPRYFIPNEACGIGAQLNELISGKRRFCEYHAADAELTGSIRERIDRIYTYFRLGRSVYSSCMMMAGAYELIGLLLDSGKCFQTQESMLTRRDLDFVDRVTDWIAENYMLPVSTQDVCRNLGYTMSHFCHMFHDNFGVSFISYLRRYRIIRATVDYRESELPISAIATAVGFSDYCYFSHTFKAQVGISPREFFVKK